MPRAQSSHAAKSHKAKPPYASSSSSSQKSKAKTKPAEWTEEMDNTVIDHVMARSEIWIKFDWKELIKEDMPGMKVDQVCHIG